MSLSVQETAIALLLAQHNATLAQNEEVQAEQVRRDFAAARPVKSNKSNKIPIIVKGTVQESPITSPIHQPKVPGLDLGQKEVITAQQFLLGLRRISSKSATYRNETMQLIHAYCGYDPKGNFGSQEAAARTKAQRELGVAKVSAGPTLAETRAASRSVAGYVAGLPASPVDRRAQDLQGRLVVVMDEWREAPTPEAKAEAEIKIQAVQLLIEQLG